MQAGDAGAIRKKGNAEQVRQAGNSGSSVTLASTETHSTRP